MPHLNQALTIWVVVSYTKHSKSGSSSSSGRRSRSRSSRSSTSRLSQDLGFGTTVLKMLTIKVHSVHRGM